MGTRQTPQESWALGYRAARTIAKIDGDTDHTNRAYAILYGARHCTRPVRSLWLHIVINRRANG